MDQFGYIMVLVSIIIGLGITHLLMGAAAIVDRVASGSRRLRPSAAFFAWLGVIFFWLVQFWWWEFRFIHYVSVWTISLYYFLVLYAVTLFLLAAVLVPRDWDSLDDLGTYLIDRRHWFYPLLLFAVGLDIADGYLKGGVAYLLAQDRITFVFWAVTAAACIVGMRTTRIRHHSIAAVTVLILQIVTGFGLKVLGK